MKKVAFILLITIILTCNVSAKEESFQWTADPVFEIAVANPSPVRVLREDLTVDLYDSERNAYSRLTSVYEISNPTDEQQQISLVYPFLVWSELHLFKAHFSVSDSEGEMNYRLFYGETIDHAALADLDFAEAFANFIYESPREPADGMMYELVIDPSAVPEDVSIVEIHFRVKPNGGIPHTIGFFDETIHEDGTVELIEPRNIRMQDSEKLTVFVPGGNLESFSLAVNDHLDREKKLDSNICTIVEREISFRDYVYQYYFNIIDTDIPEPKKEEYKCRYWNILSKLASEDETSAQSGVVTIRDVYYGPQLAIAVYTIDFAPNETKQITARTIFRATIHSRNERGIKTYDHTYTYLPGPAKTWEEFGAICLTVIKDSDELAFHRSYPELKADPDGKVYTAELSGLPREPIQFTVTRTTAKISDIFRANLLEIFLGVLLISAILHIVVNHFYSRRPKKKQHEQTEVTNIQG